MTLGNKFVRLVGGLLLLFFAGLALFLTGCGGASNSNPNQPLIVEGTWKVTASAISGSSGFTANIMVLTPQSGHCLVNTPLGINFDIINATTCFIADPNANQGSISSVTGSWAYPPAGFLIGLSSADPVPANSSAQMFGFLVETDGANVVVMDLNGTISASTKTLSGTFSCDAQSPNTCSYSGNFTATHQ